MPRVISPPAQIKHKETRYNIHLPESSACKAILQHLQDRNDWHRNTGNYSKRVSKIDVGVPKIDHRPLTKARGASRARETPKELTRVDTEPGAVSPSPSKMGRSTPDKIFTRTNTITPDKKKTAPMNNDLADLIAPETPMAQPKAVKVQVKQRSERRS